MSFMNTIFVIRKSLALLAAFAVVGQIAHADDELFDIQELATIGRVVTTRFADFDGDQRKDLMVVSFRGVPPEDSRTIWVHLRAADGSLPATPSHSLELPRWSTVFDVADLKEAPGEELVLLRPDGVTIFSIADASGQQWDIPVEGATTVGAGDDERGFDSFQLVYPDFETEPWILVPQIGMVTAVAADGTVKAQLEVGRRANFFVVQSSGPFSVESDIQLFLDVPKLSIGDVDGDGLTDIVASTRHEIRVFLRADDGSYSRQADRLLPIGLINERDHSRGSGSLVTTLRDIDADGLLDLMITHVEGTFAKSITTTTIYRNREDGWDLIEPDQSFVTEGAVESNRLIDIDGDSKLELLRIQLKFSVLEIIELLLTQAVDTQILAHRLQDDGRFGDKPWQKRKISTGISFDTFRPKGFIPPIGVDVNGDGFMDFISAADGKGIEVFLGNAEKPSNRRTARQKLASTGTIRFSDFDDDGLLDFVLFDSQQFDVPLKIGRNLGALPGTPKFRRASE